ncbi:MAG: glycosyltransferase [Kofleriaceae bacterium]
MTEKLRVLFAIPSLDRDGPDRVMFELLTALDRTRFVPSLLVSEPTGHYLSRLPADVAVTVLGTQDSLRTRYPFMAALRAVRRQAPDVVLATLRMTYTLGLVAPAFPRHTRLVLRQANDFTTDFARLVDSGKLKHRIAKALSLTALRRADAIVCQSEAMRADLQAHLGEGPPLFAIGNPVDVDAVLAAATAATPVLAGRPALVAVGRLMAQKGFDLLLPAIVEVRHEHPDLHLTILGDGPDRSELEAQTRRLDLERSVTFRGFSDQVLPQVRAADLFVLASRYEGFPNAALEALACGTPVVLTDCPGANVEIVIPGVNGRLATAVEPHAVAVALATAIRELAGYDRTRITADTRSRYAARRITADYEAVLARS